MLETFAVAWIMVSFFMLFLLSIVFWFWMLIDLLQRDTKDKLVWVLILLSLFVIGALLYYFMVYSKKTNKKKRVRKKKRR